jgi:ATP-binding cassette subfamily C protein LapB
MTAVALTERIPETLSAALREGRLGAFRATSAVAACLVPLLEALRWRGHPRDVVEALPHVADDLDLVGLRNTLANLGYATKPLRIPLDRIDPRLMPCVFVPDDGAAMVLLGPADNASGALRVFDAAMRGERRLPLERLGGTAFVVVRREPDQSGAAEPQPTRWFRSVASRFRRLAMQALGLSLLLNLLGLLVPIFIMVVYDRVVATGSYATLAYLGGGMVIVLGFEIIFRAIRARMLAYLGARIDMVVGASSFRQLIELPAGLTEGATVGAQIARLKQFEAIRDFCTGPLALVYLELPFAPLFLGVIAVLGGPLAAIPVVMVGLFVLIGAIVHPRMRDRIHRSARNIAERQSFLVEALSHMRAIKTAAMEDIWLERHRGLSAQAAIGGFEVGRQVALVQTAAHVLMLGAGIAVLAFGILRVLDASMTVGALIATMALVWRVLAPLQAGFVSLTKLEQVRTGIRQIDALMRLPAERRPGARKGTRKRFPGRVTFSRVSMRYGNAAEPALIGVGFDIRPGQLVGVVGPNGSGKSTILKLILGLYRPQAGGILLDGLDIRQLDPVELRHTIAYVPQHTHLFHGTIAQNLRLAEPTATDEQLRQALHQAGVLDAVLALPDGLETRVGDWREVPLPLAIDQRIALARAYVREAPVYLFDEPTNGLDNQGDRDFLAQLERLRGRATVFLTTHRPSHMRAMDRLLVLDRGILRADGDPATILEKIPDSFL